MQSNESDILYCQQLKIKTKQKYHEIKKIYCPILKTEIIFNSIGFRHLQYKSDGTPRKTREVIYKLKLFPLAVPTIKNALIILDRREIRIRISRKKDAKIKNAVTYSLLAEVGKNIIKIKVIVLKIGNGNFVFYSIMKIKNKKHHN